MTSPKNLRSLIKSFAIPVSIVVLLGVVGFLTSGHPALDTIREVFLSQGERQQKSYFEDLTPIMEQSTILDSDLKKVCDDWDGGILDFTQLKQNLYLLKDRAEKLSVSLKDIAAPVSLSDTHDNIAEGFKKRISFSLTSFLGQIRRLNGA